MNILTLAMSDEMDIWNIQSNFRLSLCNTSWKKKRFRNNRLTKDYAWVTGAEFKYNCMAKETQLSYGGKDHVMNIKINIYWVTYVKTFFTWRLPLLQYWLKMQMLPGSTQAPINVLIFWWLRSFIFKEEVKLVLHLLLEKSTDICLLLSYKCVSNDQFETCKETGKFGLKNSLHVLYTR